MKDKPNIDLVSSEVDGLFTTYITDTLSTCMFKHFLNNLGDEEDRHVLELALNISNGHIQVLKDKLNKQGLPIPHGYDENDVDSNAPRLFTDPFYLFYILNMAQYGMNNYSVVLNHIARPDMRDFFTNCISESTQLLNLVVDTLQQQGLYIKSPRVEFNKEIDYIDDQNFFSGGMFGKKRNLIAREITFIFASLRQNIIGGAMISAFGQVAKSKKISDYFYRGRDLAWKKVESLNTFFVDAHIPIPSTSDSFITDSTIAPFSDKLMLSQIVMFSAASMAQDGLGMANTMRHDIQTLYSKSLLDTARFAEDGLDMLVENRWIEQPPTAIESRDLVKA